MTPGLSSINAFIDRLRARTFLFFSRGKAWRRRIALFLAVIGPGIITSNVDNDAGGIATYTQAGSAYGYALLWSLIPMTIALYVTEEMCARMGVVTGKGLSDLIREEFGFRPTFFVILAGFIVDMGNVAAEFAGVFALVGLRVELEPAMLFPAFGRGFDQHHLAIVFAEAIEAIIGVSDGALAQR